jgi:hypothetical protein
MPKRRSRNGIRTSAISVTPWPDSPFRTVSSSATSRSRHGVTVTVRVYSADVARLVTTSEMVYVPCV